MKKTKRVETKHTWNHRVIHRRYPEEELLAIHEVHYENGVPKMVTLDAISVVGESLNDLKLTLGHMLKALDKPILDYDDFAPGRSP